MTVTKHKTRIGWEVEFYVPKSTAPKGTESPTEAIRERIRRDLRRMGYPVAAGEWGSNLDAFYVRNDCSLALAYDDDGIRLKRDLVDVEIVTPPLPEREAKRALRRIFQYIQKIGGVTTEDCGLHANISFVDFPLQNVMTDACYLVPLFLRDSRILYSYRRQNNEYCESIYNALKTNAGTIGQNRTIWSILGSLRGVYQHCARKDNKCVSVNLCHIEEMDDDPSVGYIEFRCIGNKNYHKKTDRVMYSVDQYLLAMNKAITASTNVELLRDEVDRLKQAAKRDRHRKAKK